ncbi:MAG: hypothetical protein H6751_10605 [Candidatus Omnitrophica bacterium]|nr:hypothetical protein [Candidatus Omnitrophota bacterium]
MITIYLACLIFGGALLLFTMLFGGDSDLDFDMDGGLDFDTDVDLDTDADFDVHGEGLMAAIQFLSFRNLIFFSAFFGLTGSLLTWTGSSFLVTLISAIVMGLFAAILCHKLMIYLKTSESGEVSNLSECVGLNARITLPVAVGQRGKISISTNERKIQMLAEVAEEATKKNFSEGENATIVRFVDGVAHIAGEDFIA